MCLFHPSHPRGGHPPHSNLVRGKLTSPTPTLQETGPTVLRPIREDEVVIVSFFLVTLMFDLGVTLW